MTKRISAAVLFLLLAAAAAFGQAGATTQIKNGPGPLPNPANNASAYVLNSGSPGLYVCLHSPTCTSSGQWVGPFGVGSGGTCSGCANASLSNLASVAINTSLGDQGNAGFNIQTEQDNNGGDTLPAGGFNYLGGLGGRYGPGGGFFVQTGGANYGSPNVYNGGDIGFLTGVNGGSATQLTRTGNFSVTTADACCSAAPGDGGNIGFSLGAEANGGIGGTFTVQTGLGGTGGGSSTVTEQLRNSYCSLCTVNRLSNVVTVNLSTCCGYDWSWVVAGTSQITLAGFSSPYNVFDGTFTITNVSFAGGMVAMKFAQTGSNLGCNSASCGNGATASGTFTVAGGFPGMIQFAVQNAALSSATKTGGFQVYAGTVTAPGEIDFETFGSAGLIEIPHGLVKLDGSSTLSIGGAVTSVNGDATVNAGVAHEVAKADPGPLTGNTGPATLISSANGGKYRVCASALIKVPASSSSTLPSISVSYTDNDYAGTVLNTITATSTANTAGLILSGCVIIFPTSATAVSYTTGTTYQSSGGTVLTWVPHLVAEAF